MLTPLLDPRADMPLYEQLYRHIREEITAGHLPSGTRLPSKRALAAHLKVSVVTIEGAYGQLLAEGYLSSEPKRGFFVQSVGAPMAAPAPASARATAPPPAVLRYDFTTAGVDTGRFPFSTWARLMRQVLTEQDSALLQSTHPQGAPQLRRAISRYLHEFRGITAEPEQVVVGAGSEYLTGLLFQLLGREGGYAAEDPGYPKFHRILAHEGALVCPIPLDEGGLRVDALRWSGARVVHVTPSHHFPLGTVMPVGRRKELLAWAEEAPNRYIIEDDYDSEFRFSGRPIPALQSLDRSERVVYLNTFAKSLAPSLRISFLVLPPHLLERYRRDFLFYASTVPSFEQYTLASFLEGGHFERHVARMRTGYKARKEALLAAARKTGVAAGAESFSGADAGLHLLLRVNCGLGERELEHRARAVGVGVYPLSAYRLTPDSGESPPTLVMGYAKLEPEDMEPAFALLRQTWGL